MYVPTNVYTLYTLIVFTLVK